MRHISLRIQGPHPEWVERADAVLLQLRDAPNAEARHQIIDNNSGLWGELKNWLLELSHKKCWFSEAKDCFNHWHVEHFRPKKSAKDLDGTSYDGYWWLAFDWRNFRICGSVGNVKKGAFFPLRHGNSRAAPFGDVRFEDPILLDPSDEYDPGLISFDLEGRAIAAPHVTDEWEKERVRYSVERFNLNFSTLMDKRKVMWADCWSCIQECRRELNTYHRDKSNAIARDRVRQALNRLRNLVREEQEFSAVARACLLSADADDGRLRNVLQSI